MKGAIARARYLFGFKPFVGYFYVPVTQFSPPMKQFLFSLLLVLPFWCSAQAPASSWPPVVGETSGECVSALALQSQGGGVAAGAVATVRWPMNKVVSILREARPYFPNINLGQMIQAYNACNCVITYLGEGYFAVRIGGDVIIVVVGSDF